MARFAMYAMDVAFVGHLESDDPSDPGSGGAGTYLASAALANMVTGLLSSPLFACPLVRKYFELVAAAAAAAGGSKSGKPQMRKAGNEVPDLGAGMCLWPAATTWGRRSLGVAMACMHVWVEKK